MLIDLAIRRLIEMNPLMMTMDPRQMVEILAVMEGSGALRYSN